MRSDVNDCVWSRVEEIMRNIDTQIKLSKYDYNELPAGIIVTGKASGLQKMLLAMQELIAPAKIRFSNTLSFDVSVEEGNLFGGNIINESHNVVLSLVRDGETNCCNGNISEPQAKEETGKEEPEDAVEGKEQNVRMEPKEPNPEDQDLQNDEEKPEKKKKKFSLKGWWENAQQKLNEIVGDE